jgi:ribosomal-protein-alanine N-acetyltransferase
MSAARPYRPSVPAASRIRIEPMSRAHLPEVLSIERDSYPTPWSENAFVHEMERNAFARPHAGLSREGVVVGYICLWVVYEELRINNVAVAPAWRRRGVGEQLIRFALQEGRESGCSMAVLEVRPSNAAAQALYGKLGFAVTSTRRRYYSDNGEDALVMRRPLRPGPQLKGA